MELQKPASSSAAALRAGPFFRADRDRRIIKPRFGRVSKYWLFIAPSLLVILAIVLFPWVFTIWMSVHEWSPGAPPAYVGSRNYVELFTSS
ncbi:MAG TPA: hypothetical protein VF051_10530, partial [Hyphomicrobiaceae bacterium]